MLAAANLLIFLSKNSRTTFEIDRKNGCFFGKFVVLGLLLYILIFLKRLNQCFKYGGEFTSGL
jgi:hypothetical protein